jgi:hypothetical protein
LLSVRSKAGKKWMAENLPDNGERAYHEGALVVERRHIRDIASVG